MLDQDKVWALLAERAREDGVTEWERESQEGPLGSTVCLVRPLEGGYPGMLGAVALLDQGRVYGALTGAGASDLLRDRGLVPWDVAPEDLLQLVRWVTSGGNLVVVPTPPRLERHPDHALLYYTERDVMSAEEFPMVAHLPLEGRETVQPDESGLADEA